MPGPRRDRAHRPSPLAAAPSANFSWNLGALKEESAVGKAIEQKAERLINVRSAAPSPTPLGGSIDGQQVQDNSDEGPISTLAVSWMMAVKATCCRPSNETYWLCNQLSRTLYVVAFFLCVGVAIAGLVEPKLFHLDLMDWFAWSSWGAVAVTELLFLLVRSIGRWKYVDQPQRYDETTVRETVMAFVRLSPFTTTRQAVLVTLGNALGSAFYLFGLSIVHMQMMVEEADERFAIVAPADRESWTFWWTLSYVFVVAALVWAGLVDPTRLGDIEMATPWLIELMAWRVLLLGLVMPIIGTAFAVYANQCCDGDWVF